jgi:hypothetical protein
MARLVVKNRGLVRNRGLTDVDVTPDVPEPEVPPLPNPPVIVSITESSLTTDGIDIETVVDQPCQSRIYYDTNSGTVVGDYPNSTNLESSFTYATHNQRISGLTDDTTYYYRVWTKNQANQETLSEEGTFTTVALPGGGEDDLLPPLTTASYIATPSFTVPTLLQVKTDPTFGTEIIRVNPTIAQGHRYSSAPAWNCDESLFLLDYPPGGSGTPRSILNGQTFAVHVASLSTPGNFRFDPLLPNIGYGYSNPNVFRRYNVTSAGFSTNETFTLSDYSQINYTGGHGRQSNDGRYHPFSFKKSNNNWGFFIFDSVSETVVAERVCGTSSSDINSLIDNETMSWDGNWIIVQFEVTGTGANLGTWVWPRSNVTGTGRQLSSTNSHGDAGQLADGTQVYVHASQAPGGQTLVRWNLSTGVGTPLGYSLWPLHISTSNIQLPDYAGISNFGNQPSLPNFNNKGIAYLIKLSTGEVRNFAHTHKGTNTGYNYEPQFCMSPSGTRGVFRTDWDSGNIACIVAGLDVIR